MTPCDCHEVHQPRRVVLTGGPGAGKTAVLELIRLFFCEHVKALPEAASTVFHSRFPRSSEPALRQAAQRAIFHLQRELEAVANTENAAVVLCDRGTVDCAAYWTGDGDLFSAVGTTREAELARYDAVIHLRTPTSPKAYNHSNPLRVESIAREWAGHPRVFIVEPTEDFLHKAAHALGLLRDEVPNCCRHRVSRFFWEDGVGAAPPS
jgi:predicted ATPase